MTETFKWWCHPDTVGATITAVDAKGGVAMLRSPDGRVFVIDLWSDEMTEARVPELRDMSDADVTEMKQTKRLLTLTNEELAERYGS